MWNSLEMQLVAGMTIIHHATLHSLWWLHTITFYMEISQRCFQTNLFPRTMLEINTIPKFLLLRMNYIFDGGVYLITDTYNYFIIPIRKWTFPFIYYLNAYVLQCLLKLAKSIENFKYCIKSCITSLEHCVSSKLSPAYSLYSLK